MKLSDNGIRLIVGFEGKHRKLGDGRYIAYRCPAGVWTIHAGVTEGVKPGMIVTEAEGEAMFRAELSKFEAAVTRLVSVPINQNQYDALVSFAYNCGAGALAKSTILRRLNAGDYVGASRGFAAWNKGGGQVLPGLVTRRAREAALFTKPAEIIETPEMPQQVDPPADTPEGSRKWSIVNWVRRLLGLGAVGGAGGKAATDAGLDPLGIASQAGSIISAYGVQIAIASLVIGFLVFEAMRHLMQEDHDEGRAVSSGEAS